MNSSQLEGAIRSTLRLQDIVYNDMLLPEAARGNDNTLWQTYRGGVATTNRTWAFTDNPKPIQLLEAEMRFQWRIFVLAAKSIEAHHPAQDRLTWLILWTRETGVLSRALDDTNGNTVIEEAITAQGRIWIDLPFMLQDVQKAWTDAMTSMSPQGHCHNLTAAIARLAALGLCGDAFSGCGLEVMSQAFEMSMFASDLPSTITSDDDEYVQTQTNDKPGLTPQFILPLVHVWLHYAGRKLLQLSVTGNSNDQSGWRVRSESEDVHTHDSNLDRASFGTARFQLWKKELTKLKEHDFEDTTTNEIAKACSGMIDNVWDEFFGVRAHKAGVQ